MSTNQENELLTKTEFAKLCKIKLNSLSNYISRGKVIADGKKINPRNEINALFIEKRIVTRGAKDRDLIEIEKTIKGLDIRKKQREIEILELKADKIKGEVIPVELLKSTLTVQFKSVYQSFHAAADKYTSEFAHEAKLSPTKRAKFKKLLINEINAAIEQGVMETEKEINIIIYEFTEKRGQGERI